MASVIQDNFRVRKSFAKLKHAIEIPNLIDIQKKSYDKFLQIDTTSDDREDIGLQAVFKSVFPIKDFSETASLEFVSYTLEKPKYDVGECRAYGAPSECCRFWFRFRALAGAKYLNRRPRPRTESKGAAPPFPSSRRASRSGRGPGFPGGAAGRRGCGFRGHSGSCRPGTCVQSDGSRSTHSARHWIGGG